MLRRPSTFVSNRGEALGAPPPGGKTDETEVGGPPATAAPARGGRVGGAGAGKLVPRARDGRLGAVHRLAGRTVASPPERRPRAVPGRRVHPRQLLVRSAPGAAAWPWPAGVGDPAALGGEARPGRRRSVPAGRSPQVRPCCRFRSARGGHLAGRRARTAGPGSPLCGGARCAWGSVSPAHPRIRLAGKHKAAP